MKILSLPGRGNGNPYIDLFYDALVPYGVECVGQLKFDHECLIGNLDYFDAIHLHWPENIWRNYTLSFLGKIAHSDIRGTWRLSKILEKIFDNQIRRQSLKWFESNLNFLKRNGKKIIWTWHNVEPHENVDDFDRQAQQLLARKADLVIFHSQLAEAMCRNAYDIDCQTVVMSHGNYKGVYPVPNDRMAVLVKLGLDPDIPIVGMLGNIRGYKGLDLAIDACVELGDDIQFLCAGNVHPSFDWNTVVEKAAKLKYCKLIPEYISDQDFSDYLSVMDVLLLPYRKVTGSGALLASLTLGRGVVATDLPFFKEVLGANPTAGRLVSLDAFSLNEGIADYIKLPAPEREEAALTLADKYDWEDVIRPVVSVLRNLK